MYEILPVMAIHPLPVAKESAQTENASRLRVCALGEASGYVVLCYKY